MATTFIFNPNTITATGLQQLTCNNKSQSITEFAGDINQMSLQEDVVVAITSNCQTAFPNQTYIIKRVDHAYINTNYEC